MSSSKRLVSGVLAVTLAAAAFAWFNFHKARTLEVQMSASMESARKLHEEREADLTQQVEALRQQLSERGIEPVVAPPAPKSAAGDNKRLELTRELAHAQSVLATANTSIADLQNRVRDLEAQMEKITAENKRLAAAEASLKEDLDSARRVVAAADAELKAKTELVQQMEILTRKAREEQAATAKKVAQLGNQTNELTEINRRRENTLNSIQRRFRDINEQLRALVVRLDTQRDNAATAAPDISRIQTAVQNTEDDLRLLVSLNTQAQHLARELGQK